MARECSPFLISDVMTITWYLIILWMTSCVPYTLFMLFHCCHLYNSFYGHINQYLCMWVISQRGKNNFFAYLLVTNIYLIKSHFWYYPLYIPFAAVYLFIYFLLRPEVQISYLNDGLSLISLAFSTTPKSLDFKARNLMRLKIQPSI